MVEFEEGSFALGIVFPYPSPVSENKLKGWLAEEDFELRTREGGGIVFGSSGGVQFETPEEGIARRNGLRILYNADANLNGFSSSAFITAKSPEEPDHEEVISFTEEMLNWLEGMGEAESVATYEVTIQGLIRTEDTHDLTVLFTNEALDWNESVGGSEGRGITARFESTAANDSNEWYRFLIDENARGNPNLWGVNFVRRFPSISSINGEELVNSIINFVENTGE